MNDVVRQTPLNAVHREMGGRMVDFAGWDMPVQYSGILDETKAVRTKVGLFDISHMGRVHFTGPGCTDLLQRLTSNDVAALKPGFGHYSLLTNPNGGIIDDIIVYRVAEHDYWVVINASNTDKDLNWIRSHADANVTIEDWTSQTAMIAVQGPRAPAMISELSGMDFTQLGRFQHTMGKINGVEAVFCRTGYTGEDGFEVIVQATAAESLWRSLVAGGGVPCGLGARDALRIEAGYPLYGHEIDDETTPVEAALMWVVKLDKGPFTGREQIAEVKSGGAGRKLVGIVLRERIVPRQGYSLLVGDKGVGMVTSGVFSPTMGCGLGMAYIKDGYHSPESTVKVLIRSSQYDAVVVAKKDLLKPLTV